MKPKELRCFLVIFDLKQMQTNIDLLLHYLVINEGDEQIYENNRSLCKGDGFT
jgi:hypothetical protein